METLTELTKNLLPLLGVVVLILLIVVLLKLVKMLQSLTKAIDRTSPTFDLVDESIKKVQVPLDTVAKVSGTVDKAHDATIKACADMTDYVVKNAGVIKEKVDDALQTVKSFKKDEEKEPSPKDIIGG